MLFDDCLSFLTRDFHVLCFPAKMKKLTLLSIALVVLCCKVTTPLGKTTLTVLGNRVSSEEIGEVWGTAKKEEDSR